MRACSVLVFARSGRANHSKLIFGFGTQLQLGTKTRSAGSTFFACPASAVAPHQVLRTACLLEPQTKLDVLRASILSQVYRAGDNFELHPV